MLEISGKFDCLDGSSVAYALAAGPSKFNSFLLSRRQPQNSTVVPGRPTLNDANAVFRITKEF